MINIDYLLLGEYPSTSSILMYNIGYGQEGIIFSRLWFIMELDYWGEYVDNKYNNFLLSRITAHIKHAHVG